MPKKNIFLIASSNLGPEDRLTEMLAYLWQERPNLVATWLEAVTLDRAELDGWSVETQRTDPIAGRFDVCLRIPEAAYVIVESKLGSDLGANQVSRYVQHLADRGESHRAFVSLTDRLVNWPAAIDELAARNGVELRRARWRDLRATLLDTEGDVLVDQFSEMLVNRGLVKPEAFEPRSWNTWNRGAVVFANLSTLLAEADPEVEGLHTGLQHGKTSYGDRSLYRKYSASAFNLHIGFSANESSARPESAPIIWIDVENPDLVGPEGHRVADRARASTGATPIWGFQDANVWRPVARVITAPTWDGQIRNVVAFAYDALSRLKAAGFLGADVRLEPPAFPAD